MQLSQRVDGFQDGPDVVYEVGGDDAPCRMDMVMEPDLPLNSPHSHPHQRESFHVLSGTLDIKLDGKVHELHAGDEMVIEPGVMHSIGNRRASPALVYKEVLPGLDSIEFYRAMRTLEERKLDAVANTVEFAILVRRFRHLFRLPPLLSAYASTLAVVGRVTRYI